jgi:hypothetical protein
LVVKGGRAVNNTGLATNNQNARTRAIVDPSKLTIDLAGNLVLESGIGPSGTLTTASARIDAGAEMRITVRGPSTTYTYRMADGTTRTANGSLFMIGGSGSGFFDSENTPLGGEGAPSVFPITVNAAGGFVRVIDPLRSDAVVQTGLATFNESLLSYIIFAANEETRSARIRRGLSDSDDLGAPACK